MSSFVSEGSGEPLSTWSSSPYSRLLDTKKAAIQFKAQIDANVSENTEKNKLKQLILRKDIKKDGV